MVTLHRKTTQQLSKFKESSSHYKDTTDPTDPFEFTPPETNIDTQNDGLKIVTPFKYGHVLYLC